MTVNDFLQKYGTRAVPMLIRELAVRRKDNQTAREVADDLQAMLESLITHENLMQAHENLMQMDLRNAMEIEGKKSGNGHT
jgi:hypothetical protein